MAAQKQDDQHERTFSSYVRIQVVVLKTCLGRWTIGRSGERGSGISVLPARYDDVDDNTFPQSPVCLNQLFSSLRQITSQNLQDPWFKFHSFHYIEKKKIAHTFNGY